MGLDAPVGKSQLSKHLSGDTKRCRVREAPQAMARGTLCLIQTQMDLAAFCETSLHQERPKARIDEFILKNALHLFQDELLDFAHIFQHLLAFFCLTHLAFYFDFFE